MNPDSKQLEVVSKMLGVDYVTVNPVGAHYIIKVKLSPWAWVAGGLLHLRVARAARKALNDEFSLVQVWG